MSSHWNSPESGAVVNLTFAPINTTRNRLPLAFWELIVNSALCVTIYTLYFLILMRFLYGTSQTSSSTKFTTWRKIKSLSLWTSTTLYWCLCFITRLEYICYLYLKYYSNYSLFFILKLRFCTYPFQYYSTIFFFFLHTKVIYIDKYVYNEFFRCHTVPISIIKPFKVV